MGSLALEYPTFFADREGHFSFTKYKFASKITQVEREQGERIGGGTTYLSIYLSIASYAHMYMPPSSTPISAFLPIDHVIPCPISPHNHHFASSSFSLLSFVLAPLRPNASLALSPPPLSLCHLLSRHTTAILLFLFVLAIYWSSQTSTPPLALYDVLSPTTTTAILPLSLPPFPLCPFFVGHHITDPCLWPLFAMASFGAFRGLFQS